MKTFTMHLQSATQHQQIDGVTNFIGEDTSGSFGLRANHARMIIVLNYGLARFSRRDGMWQYLALPGAVLYFVANTLYINTRHYLLDTDYQRISGALLEQLLQEESQVRATKENIFRLEQEMFRRLWKMEQP